MSSIHDLDAMFPKTAAAPVAPTPPERPIIQMPTMAEQCAGVVENLNRLLPGLGTVVWCLGALACLTGTTLLALFCCLVLGFILHAIAGWPLVGGGFGALAVITALAAWLKRASD